MGGKRTPALRIGKKKGSTAAKRGETNKGNTTLQQQMEGILEESKGRDTGLHGRACERRDFKKKEKAKKSSHRMVSDKPRTQKEHLRKSKRKNFDLMEKKPT